MLRRKAPLHSGRETEIDMIEREMEGGVLVVQVPAVHEHDVKSRLGGLIGVEKHVDVHERSNPAEAARGSGRGRRGPSREE
jgi:hypothetical protein